MVYTTPDGVENVYNLGDMAWVLGEFHSCSLLVMSFNVIPPIHQTDQNSSPPPFLISYLVLHSLHRLGLDHGPRCRSSVFRFIKKKKRFEHVAYRFRWFIGRFVSMVLLGLFFGFLVSLWFNDRIER